MARQSFAAVDLGASGGRVMRGEVVDGRVKLFPVHRFANAMIEGGGHLRWDVTGLYDHMMTGLREARDVASVGIDTWGVDYGLLDVEGELLAQPTAYRDTRTAAAMEEAHALVRPEELYAATGVKEASINTVYQLVAERHGPLWSRAARAVLLPDLFAYWLTGQLRSEVTAASTTGLLDARSNAWSEALFDRLGLPTGLLPPVEGAGSIRGTTPEGIPVVAVASHDTASAVVGVPATIGRFAFISCGTWSIVGMEATGPILTEVARQAGFTNELGLDNRTRFQKNLSGFWLVEECRRAWQRRDLEALLDAAASVPAGGPRIDVSDPAFLSPGNMPERIGTAVGAAMDPAQIIRCILDSLAEAYAHTVRAASRLVGNPVEAVHIVGGGSQSDLLCQLTADAAGLPVLAGPAEATAVGNVMVQARALGTLPYGLDEMRSIQAAANPPRRFEPS